MQQFVVVRRFMQQPLIVVLGVLTGAGAAKSGYGAWAAGGILAFLSIHFGALVTFMATRSLAAWIARMRRYGRPRRASSRRPSFLMQLAAPHQAPGDVGRLQRRAFGR